MKPENIILVIGSYKSTKHLDANINLLSRFISNIHLLVSNYWDQKYFNIPFRLQADTYDLYIIKYNGMMTSQIWSKKSHHR